MHETPNRESTVNISGSSNTSARDIIGGDVVHNIIIVGQLMHAVGIEDFLPQIAESMAVPDLAKAVEIGFSGPNRDHVLEATSIAGKFAAEVLKANQPSDSRLPFHYEEVLRDLPKELHRYLLDFMLNKDMLMACLSMPRSNRIGERLSP